MATIRGPGLFEGNFVRERMVDMLAHELGIDSLELRRRNLIPFKMMPYNVGTNIFGHPRSCTAPTSKECSIRRSLSRVASNAAPRRRVI